MVSLDGRGHRQRHPGVPRCALYDRPARLESSRFLGGLDDRETDAVLHGAPWVEHLGLRVDRRSRAVGHPAQADERRLADRLEDVVVRRTVYLHGSPFLSGIGYRTGSVAQTGTGRSPCRAGS